MARRQRAAALAAVGGAVALIGTFLPWVRSGAQSRSSYSTFELVERLGFAPSGPVSISLRLWPLAPLLLVTSVVASVWTSTLSTSRTIRFATAVLVVTTAVWVGATAAAVGLAQAQGLVGIGRGPAITVVGASILALAGAVGFSAVRIDAEPACGLEGLAR